MVYDAGRFDALSDRAWDDERIRAGIREIVADADAAFDESLLWPADEWDAWHIPTPLKSLYVGAAGVIWALDTLRRRGVADSGLDLSRAAGRTLDAWRAEPDLMRGVALPEPARAAFLTGQTGILAVAYRLDPAGEVADEIYERVRENVSNTATGVMWGTAGSLLVARALDEWTHEERWAEAWRDGARRLLAARDGQGLWEQRLYGETFRGLGTLYGLVGNVLALRGGARPPSEAGLEARTAALLRDTAVVEDDLVNGPAAAGARLRGGDGELRLQWCCGAPGIVGSAAAYLDEDLLLGGAETVWRAGPHGREKGAGLCHGTAGNGYALLKAFERTQDELWLDRARRFAVHALEQALAARTERGRGRYSLWTGDVGVAIFAADCLAARTRYPVLETWD
jgi:hypothetical protein